MSSKWIFIIFLLHLVLGVRAGTAIDEDTQYIGYLATKIKIDGSLEEWDMERGTLFYLTDLDSTIVDSCRVSMQWDEHFLYLGFQSYDQNLMKKESGNHSEYLWRNDGMEIYIDPKHDSDSSMNMNDYNLIIDLTGEYTIYTVTRENIEHPLIVVPKRNTGVEYYIESATQLDGSLNDTTDIDNGYSIELKIPWAPLGILPAPGDTIKVDVCSNNLNQFSKPEEWCSYVHMPPGFYYTSWNGSHDFGHPHMWKKLVLVGSMNPLKSWVFDNYKWMLLSGLSGILLLGAIIWNYRRGVKELTELIQKSEIANEQLLAQIESHNNYTHPQGENGHKEIYKEPDVLSKLQQIIESNVESISKPSDLAQAMNISLRKLQRICKEKLSITPGAYITTFKMERAGQELRYGSKSIKAIAYELGYSDPSYFSKAFKKYFDLSPKEFRMRYIQVS